MKNKIIYSLLALCIIFTSCEKFLDVTPKTQVPTEDMFSQELGYEDALIGCYTKMNSSNLYGKFLTLNGVDHLAQYYDGASASIYTEALVNFNYTNSYVEPQIKSTYNEFYNTILQLNDIIEHIDMLQAKDVVKSETKRNHIKGEALALRGFLHFDLLRLFGQMPQNASKNVSLAYSEVTGVEARPTYGFDQYIEKVKADLTAAEKLLADDPYTKISLNSHTPATIEDDFYHYRKFRFNYWAVKALQARVYLYIGDTQNAYTTAKELIEAKAENGSNYFTLANDADLDNSNFALPTETIMGLSNRDLELYSYESMFKTPQNNNPQRFSKQRRDEMFTGRNTSNNNRYNKMWGEIVSVVGSLNPYYKKYMQNEDNADAVTKLNSRWLIPLLRVSELYLIAMETSTDLTEVNNWFYTYMVARNEQAVPFETIEDAKEEIINEYRREFMAEGQMFFTYKRLGATTMKWRNKEVTEENYIIPIPLSEMN